MLVNEIPLALTYDDLLLVPQKSAVIPDEVSLKTKLTKDITLNIPLLAAAMDTVSESKMAVALARLGGLAFIHKNMSIEEQANQVSLVKRSESGMVANPITLKSSDSVKDAMKLLMRFDISGLPVIDENNILLGIITNRDLRYLDADDTPVLNVMTKDVVVAKEGVSMREAQEILWENRIEKLPVVDAEGHLVGLITSKDIDNLQQYPNAVKDDKGRLLCGAAVGVGKDTMDRVEALVKAGVDVIAVDSAHGHSMNIINMVKNIHNKYPELPLIAGNIVTVQAAKELIEAGVSAVKVGIGPGSICTTRIVAGVGVPQASAVNEVANYCKTVDIPVIADGGIKYSGDIAKALALGANCVMLGSLFAGCTESPGEEIIYQGRRFKSYVGMGSLAAMRRGSADRYFQGDKKYLAAGKLVPEGIEGRVPFKGPVSDSVYQLCGGIRSGMGYMGAESIVELQKRAKFVRITNAGLKENHPHDVEITVEAPNYSR